MSPFPPADADRWRRIEAILDEVLELSPDERLARLDDACRGDPELRSEVEALLAADRSADARVDRPAAEYAATLLAEPEEPTAGLTEDAQVGPYRLLRELGHGGMGDVYEAEDARLGRRVAIKFLPREASRDREALRRFLREARAASALDHPNICTVHDLGEHEGRPYIVMARYEGETLRERLARGPLPVAEAREIALQLARALERAHEAEIVHRDLKPANVMLTRRGETKLLDFGIAKLGGEASLTSTAGSWGTPAYMSPEQVRGKPTDGRTDLWSLGAVLYEMIAGRRPFRGEGVQAVLSSILTEEPEPLDRVRPDVPLELARTVARLLAKDRARRYRSATDLLRALETRSGLMVQPPLRHRRTTRRLLAGLVAGAVVAAAVVALTGPGLPLRLWGPPTVRVAILNPTLTASGEDPEVSFAASAVVQATVATLISLEGVQPLDPPPPDEGRGSQAEALRAGEADEVLRPLLDCEAHGCRVTLRRLSGPAGAVLATVGPFEVQTGIDRAQRLEEAVRVHVLRLYRPHRPRTDAPGDRVRPEDFAAFVELDRRSDRGERLGSDALDRLESILETSPDLLGAHLLAAGVARLLADPGRALGYAELAHRLAPYDPRPLLERFRIEKAEARFADAQVTLERLAELAPGDVRVQIAEAELLAARGELAEARRVREEIVHRRPSWRQVLELAILEVRLGESASARARLRDLLAEQPDNQYVLETLAFLESLFGEPADAAELYERLVAIIPARPHLSNLGFVRYLLGDYAGAAAADRRALELEPGHLLTRFNLATAREAQGRTAEAAALYQDLVESFAGGSDQEPGAHGRMLHAQCLARLGRRQQAARLGEEVLRQAPQDLQVLHQAAQLQALLGERLATLYYTERALRNGLRWEWFTIPEFDPLADDPDFQTLLNSYRPPPPASSPQRTHTDTVLAGSGTSSRPPE